MSLSPTSPSPSSTEQHQPPIADADADGGLATTGSQRQGSLDSAAGYPFSEKVPDSSSRHAHPHNHSAAASHPIQPQLQPRRKRQPGLTLAPILPNLANMSPGIAQVTLPQAASDTLATSSTTAGVMTAADASHRVTTRTQAQLRMAFPHLFPTSLASSLNGSGNSGTATPQNGSSSPVLQPRDVVGSGAASPSLTMSGNSNAATGKLMRAMQLSSAASAGLSGSNGALDSSIGIMVRMPFRFVDWRRTLPTTCTMGIPVGLALNFVIDGVPTVVPMAVEEPSVIAAVSGAAKILSSSRDNIGFRTTSPARNIITAQVLLLDQCLDLLFCQILAKKKDILAVANQYCSNMYKRARACHQPARAQDNHSLFSRAPPTLLFHYTLSRRHHRERFNPLARGPFACRRVRRHGRKLRFNRRRGSRTLAARVIEAYQWARDDPYRATTHNKGIMNGIDAVALATGQDWRAVEAACHSWAAGNGQEGSRKEAMVNGKSAEDEWVFCGELALPIIVGTKGGVLATAPLYHYTLGMMGFPDSKQLAAIMCCVGLAQNFAALRALATEGIQRGHMHLHARNIAIAAGAPTHAIPEVTAWMIEKGRISVDAAREYVTAHHLFTSLRHRLSSLAVANKSANTIKPPSMFYFAESHNKPLTSTLPVQSILLGGKTYEWLMRMFPLVDAIKMSSLGASPDSLRATNELTRRLKTMSLILNALLRRLMLWCPEETSTRGPSATASTSVTSTKRSSAAVAEKRPSIAKHIQGILSLSARLSKQDMGVGHPSFHPPHPPAFSGPTSIRAHAHNRVRQGGTQQSVQGPVDRNTGRDPNQAASTPGRSPARACRVASRVPVACGGHFWMSSASLSRHSFRLLPMWSRTRISSRTLSFLHQWHTPQLNVALIGCRRQGSRSQCTFFAFDHCRGDCGARCARLSRDHVLCLDRLATRTGYRATWSPCPLRGRPTRLKSGSGASPCLAQCRRQPRWTPASYATPGDELVAFHADSVRNSVLVFAVLQHHVAAKMQRTQAEGQVDGEEVEEDPFELAKVEACLAAYMASADLVGLRNRMEHAGGANGYRRPVIAMDVESGTRLVSRALATGYLSSASSTLRAKLGVKAVLEQAEAASK
ncbi:hypothetical protein BCR44DRAFT_1439805 [Catenaria anguillulae PL171]|uniref:hydroxymethylglutaryl-CoA reductase (NADPH) n=1 Tax=Catenaria anguillulae PL171 TaxID=765915 RepID=A0A1Y2HDR9_9FUNG|nr:hypothetical protein BCR44DRAFT_1439805 [Catenaria anguillulae PL171]